MAITHDWRGQIIGNGGTRLGIINGVVCSFAEESTRTANCLSHYRLIIRNLTA